MRRVFTSLGLPKEAFKGSNTTPEQKLFDAVLNADAHLPGRMWLFKGSDYFLYNLVSGESNRGLALSGTGAAAPCRSYSRPVSTRHSGSAR
jgi:hypothetical protein